MKNHVPLHLLPPPLALLPLLFAPLAPLGLAQSRRRLRNRHHLFAANMDILILPLRWVVRYVVLLRVPT